MRLSWKEKDKRLIKEIEQLRQVAQEYGLQMTDIEQHDERLREVAREYGLQMTDIEQHDQDWNDPIEEENEVKITKEYAIIFVNREPLTIVANYFEFYDEDQMYYFYDEEDNKIAAFDKAYVIGISLTTGSTIQNFGISAPVPTLPAPQDRRTL